LAHVVGQSDFCHGVHPRCFNWRISFSDAATTEIIEAITHRAHLIRNPVGALLGFLKDGLDRIGVMVAGWWPKETKYSHSQWKATSVNSLLMIVFDLDKNKPIAFLPMADGPDVIRFDPGLDRIYAACYSGAISVFHQDDPNHYRKLEDFPVQHAVHSLVVDLSTHRVYTLEQEENHKPMARLYMTP